ncbi:unnamed protein product [Nezara viridula]|uniref:Uncharacterized protein n=1 Tax=Nezara viridula TaxID=85310 RepID=A0A9P0EBW8_NEZVI|nr:unnamed protein product [Nezara viridula]
MISLITCLNAKVKVVAKFVPEIIIIPCFTLIKMRQTLSPPSLKCEPPLSLDQFSHAVSCHATTYSQILLGTALGRIFSSSGQWYSSRMVVDPGSQTNLITTDLMKKLCLRSRISPLVVSGGDRAEKRYEDRRYEGSSSGPKCLGCMDRGTSTLKGTKEVEKEEEEEERTVKAFFKRNVKREVKQIKSSRGLTKGLNSASHYVLFPANS